MEDNTKNAGVDLQLREASKEEAKLIATSYFDPVIWAQMKGMAETFIISKALPSYIQNAAQAVMTMQAGFEMGMKPVESLHSLYPVNGVFNIWGKATTRRLRMHGYIIKYIEETPELCAARVWKPGTEEVYEETFYYKDAVASGWTKTYKGEDKVGWKAGQNRKLKMRYGVLSAIIKSYIPDVLGSATDIAEVAEDYVLPTPSAQTPQPAKVETPQQPAETKRPSLKEKLDSAKSEEDSADEAEVVDKKAEPASERPEPTKVVDGAAATVTPQDSKPAEEVKKPANAEHDKARKEFFAMARQAGVSAEHAKASIKEFYKVESLKDIATMQFKIYSQAMRTKWKKLGQKESEN